MPLLALIITETIIQNEAQNGISKSLPVEEFLRELKPSLRSIAFK